MAKFPSYERRQGLAGGSTGPQANVGAFTAPARALAQAGEGMADLGGNLMQIESKVRETQDNTWFSKARAQTAIDISAQERELQKQATGGAPDFTPRVQGVYGEYRAGKEAEAPSPRAKQMYSQWADSYGVDVTGRAAKFQAESELAKRTTDFSDTINAHAQAVFADPTQYDTVKKRMDDDFAGAKQWMTPEQEQVAKASAEKTLQLARAKSLVEYKPEQFMAETGTAENVTGEGAVNRVVQKIIGVESGGNASAKNPNSSASGLGQFIDSTWLTTVRKYRPDLAGQSDSALLAMKTDPALGREMTTRFTEENANGLKSNGVAVTPGNLYLAHFAGLGGAIRVNTASDGESVAAVLGPSVVKANSFLQGKTVGDLKQWAAKKMGGPVAPNVAGNPAYKDLSIDEIASLQNKAEATSAANQTNLYNQMKGTMELGVKTGSILSEDEILSSGLRDDDKASLLGTFRSQNKDQMEINAALQGLTSKTLSVDPYNDKAKKALDGAYDAIVAKATPEQKGLAGEEIVRQSGVVPQALLNEMRRGLESTNPSDIAAAAQQASRISQINPAALSRREGGSGVQKAADDFGYYVNNLNMTPEQAAQKIADANNPEKVRERKALEPAVKEFNKQIAEEDVADIFDESWLSDPAVGFNEGQRLGIQAEYNAIAEEQFYLANGDAEIAKNRAKEEMKRLYGVTNMTGTPVVMKHPPERYWPTIDTGGDPLQYAHTQLYADIYAIDPEVDQSKIQLVSTPETDAMVKRGEMPAYAVFYPDKNGVLQTMPGKLWRPDPANHLKMQEQRNSATQSDAEDQARFRQDINRTDAEMAADPDAARAASQDAFIAGPETTPAAAFKKNKGK